MNERPLFQLHILVLFVTFFFICLTCYPRIFPYCYILSYLDLSTHYSSYVCYQLPSHLCIYLSISLISFSPFSHTFYLLTFLSFSVSLLYPYLFVPLQLSIFLFDLSSCVSRHLPFFLPSMLLSTSPSIFLSIHAAHLRICQSIYTCLPVTLPVLLYFFTLLVTFISISMFIFIFLPFTLPI